MIREIILHVGDLGEAVAFYRDACGFDHVRTVADGGAEVAEMDADGVRVTLVAGTAPGTHLALDTSDVRAERRRLRRLDVEQLDEEPIQAEGGAWVGFSDPWGNRLGYFEERRPG